MYHQAQPTAPNPKNRPKLSKNRKFSDNVKYFIKKSYLVKFIHKFKTFDHTLKHFGQQLDV